MGTISREQVLTTGGVTRLVDRMTAAGLVERGDDPGDRRGRLVRLTPLGEEKAVQAARVHVANIERHFLAPLPASHRQRFMDDLRILSHAARDAVRCWRSPPAIRDYPSRLSPAACSRGHAGCRSASSGTSTARTPGSVS